MQEQEQAFVAQLAERMPFRCWSTIRYAVEQYMVEQEAKLEELIASNDTKTSLQHRAPGHYEEVSLTAELVAYGNEILQHITEARKDFGVDA